MLTYRVEDVELYSIAFELSDGVQVDFFSLRTSADQDVAWSQWPTGHRLDDVEDVEVMSSNVFGIDQVPAEEHARKEDDATVNLDV